ncbi:MAG: DsbA family protein [Candidatus Peribacteraceae bacterium]
MADTSSKNNPWFAICMGLVGVIVGYGIAMSNGAMLPSLPAQAGDQPTAAPTEPTAPPPVGDVVPVDSEEDHVRGNPDATISIIEYSDYQCPYCQRNGPTLQKLIDAYEGDVNWVFRHFPLSFHPYAQKAAEASECAADQGGNDAFWQFHDKLFDGGVETEKLEAYAQELGLNVATFNDCVESGKFEQKVKDQFESGSTAGVRGTPGNIIYNNETKDAEAVTGAQPYDNFVPVIDAMLK